MPNKADPKCDDPMDEDVASAPGGRLKQYASPLCHCGLPCWLSACGIGFIPLYEIARVAAPTQVWCLRITVSSAMLWAFLLWVSSTPGLYTYLGILATDNGFLVLVTAMMFALVMVKVKQSLRIDESNVVTCAKGICCVPCFVGQMAATVERMRLSRLLARAKDMDLEGQLEL
eukprot:TRINITY_DN29585_c0_g1_i2.p1 TRINITY_DN29585_c0_g1~~TRINITY_DN29585_c0_g1_i2.p1  ORF type:complete len:173 (-),score=27.60 TRINITY_DN29585_c0_g1_i2:236-754(-)